MALKTTSILQKGTNNHPTTSEEANFFATDFVTPGVLGTLGNTLGLAPMTGNFAVNAQGTPNMTVAVSAGKAYVQTQPSTQNSQVLRSYMNASENVIIAANASGATRYDFLYLAHNATTANNPAVGGDDVATLYVSRSTSSTTDNNAPPAYGELLAIITVPNGAASIANSQIRDVRRSVTLSAGTSSSNSDWRDLSAYTFTFSASNGNREYVINTSTDLRSIIGLGARWKQSRAITPPTQCADFESSSSQYASKSAPSGIVFADDFTAEAWIKPESYTGTSQTIISRYDGSTGFIFYIAADGSVRIYGKGAADREFASYNNVPTDEWTHIAATLDMSGGIGHIYINGVEVSSRSTAGAGISLTQAGNLQIGAFNSGAFFDGEIQDARLWNTVRSAAQIRDNKDQQLVGTETGLVGYWPLNGNFNDLSASGNNLTAVNGAIATSVDTAMNAIEYGIITNITSTQITIFTPIGYSIPNQSIASPAYSTQGAPYGFPRGREKWRIAAMSLVQLSQAAGINVWVNPGNFQLSIPRGEWLVTYSAKVQSNPSPSSAVAIAATLSTANNSEINRKYTVGVESGVATPGHGAHVMKTMPLTLQTQTPYYLNVSCSAASTNYLRGDNESTDLYAECAYL